MSGVISGTHLKSYKVEGKHSQKELNRFGEWTASVNFEPISDEVGKCKHEDRHRKLEPVLKELKFEARNFHCGANKY